MYLSDVKVILGKEEIIISYSCDVLKEFFSKYVVEWSKNDYIFD